MNYIIKGAVIRKGDRIIFGSEKLATVVGTKKGFFSYEDELVVRFDGGNRDFTVGLDAPMTFLRRGNK